MSLLNRQFRLIARPAGLPKRTDFQFTEEPVPEPADGQVLVKTLYISLDPALRGIMNEARSYADPVPLGEVMRAGTGGRVIASKHPGFGVGDAVTGWLGVQEYAVSSGLGLSKVDTRVVPLPVQMGVLGGTGMTAYFGLLETGKLKPGDVVVVSGAAGAVGSIAGQIAKIKGCPVVGIAGGPEKCRHIVEDLSFDAAIDYKSQDVAKELARLCPQGVDVYFDNVGGEILDAVLTRLARGARIVICGAISQYNNTSPFKGPSNYFSLLVQRASMTGMLVMDYAAQFDQARREMAAWIAAGKLKSREDIVEGFESFPETFLRLFTGANTGKLLLKVAES